ncbi:MAG: cyclic nucleotide-binding domain-containing protein [Opitutales bacterium]
MEIAQDSDHIVDEMINCPLFSSLDPDQLNKVAGFMENWNMNSDEVLFEEGANGYFMGFVVSGMLKLLKETSTGGQTVIGHTRKGDVIGEMSLVDDQQRSASAIAAKPTELLVLKRNQFEVLLEEQPRIGVKLLRSIIRMTSQHLRRTSSALADEVTG